MINLALWLFSLYIIFGAVCLAVAALLGILCLLLGAGQPRLRRHFHTRVGARRLQEMPADWELRSLNAQRQWLAEIDLVPLAESKDMIPSDLWLLLGQADEATKRLILPVLSQGQSASTLSTTPQNGHVHLASDQVTD